MVSTSHPYLDRALAVLGLRLLSEMNVRLLLMFHIHHSNKVSTVSGLGLLSGMQVQIG